MSKSITVSSVAYVHTDDVDPEKHINAGPVNDAMIRQQLLSGVS